MSWWQRIGGPSGITFLGWLLLSPISIFFTVEVVPEGYLEGWSRPAGYLLGTISHLATGLVLLLGRLAFLRDVSEKPRPVATILIMGAAGLTRGVATAYLLEALSITANADYLDRMASGAALIIIWFSAIAVVVDSRKRYRYSYLELSELVERQRLLKERGHEILSGRERELVSQVRQTLQEALRVGAKTSDIHNAVEELVRPLSHSIAKSRPQLEAEATTPRIRIRFWPIAHSAFAKTPYSFGPVIFVSVLGTLYSKLWQLGVIGLIDSVLSALFIWLFFSLGARLKKYGWWTWLFWLMAGLASGLTTGMFTGINPLENPSPAIYLSLNVLIPAVMVAFLKAYDYQAESNLSALKEILDSVHWETVALQQQAWVQQKRIARFVHSDLQARIRAFALRLDISGSDPKPEDIEELRAECEKSLALGGEYQDFEKFIAELQDLWEGVVMIGFEADELVRGSVAGDPFTQIALVEIVREGVSNAVKHGRASQVRVRLTEIHQGERSNIEVEIVDNGAAIAEKGAGLGSEVLDELSVSWQLTESPNGAALHAVLPVREALAVS